MLRPSEPLRSLLGKSREHAGGGQQPPPQGVDAAADVFLAEGSAESAGAQRRYEKGLVGGVVRRLDATDPELRDLLQWSVPLVVCNSGLVEEATARWSFEYLERHLSDVDNFYVLCAPPRSRGRIAYFDLSPKKNPCKHEVVQSNERREMRFPDFRKKALEARRRKKVGKKGSSFYLQTALLHKEENEPGPPRPVGGFGTSCGFGVARDMEQFRWQWLKDIMSGRDVQMCQLFCGFEGDFSPCHYDPQDNIFVQVRGYKRVILFHPRHFGCLYPWPVHHPQDRQSRVDFDEPDVTHFPRYAELQGQGLEAVLGPGDLLHIPPGWWHHIEMLPSQPQGEVVSVNFWYPAPKWWHGDPTLGEQAISWDKPLFGARRVLFQRCVEELAAQGYEPAQVENVIRRCLEEELPAEEEGKSLRQTALAVRNFVATVFPKASDYATLLREVVEGRFRGL